MTVWKDIPNYEGLYQVSDSGQVRSLDRTDSRGRKWKGKVLKTWPDGLSGYLQVCLSKEGKVIQIRIHRLITLAFHGLPSGRQANHKNGEKTDNRAHNLEWMTCSENVKHRINVLGIQNPAGESHACSKLTAKQVKEIRRLCAQGKNSQKSLAHRFGVTPSAISQIFTRRTWKHI